MAKKEELKNTMAAALAGLNPTAAPKAVKQKTRRKSQIETEPLPEPKKRTRRKKDPALKKTHSFTLLMTEQLYKRFKATAEEQGYSMNGIATRLIKKYVFLHDVEMEEEDIENYGTE
jgi:hypothetical protein